MSTKSWFIILAIILTIAGVVAYTPLIHVVHIRINQISSEKIEVWEEKTSTIPVVVTPPYEYKQMAKKLFGKENPTLLDAVKRVIEMPKGREKVQKLVNYYGAVFFMGISESYHLEDYSINVYAFPLTKPTVGVIFEFHYNKEADTFSLETTRDIEDIESTRWRYRNVTDEELKLLLDAHGISHYNNTFFVADESEGVSPDILPLIGLAWESEAIELNGFKAYKGVRINVVVFEDGGKDKFVDEIVVITLPPKTTTNNSKEYVLQKVLQDDEVRELAKQKDLLFLISSDDSLTPKYWINIKELRKPEELLGVYTYSPEGLFKRSFKVILPSATYEMISEGEARKYNVTLNMENRVYIKCAISGEVYSVTGIGWNKSVNLMGFEVSRAEIVRSVKTNSGWLSSRDQAWIVRGVVE